MTQAEFGEAFGFSAEMVKSVENGRREVSPRLADVVAGKTGFDLMTLTYFWGLREKGGIAVEKYFGLDRKVVFAEERRLDEYTKEEFDRKASRPRNRYLTADEFIDEIRPYLLTAYEIAYWGGRSGPERVKEAVLQALRRVTRKIWNETGDVLPDDLPEEK